MIRFRRRLLTVILFLSVGGRAAIAQQPTSAPIPGEELTVYLVTMGAGDELSEKFGHTAIWIHDSAAGTDVAYNWGLYDFDEQDFIPRLAAGKMRYSMGALEMREMLQYYGASNRSVWAQELNLSPLQRRELRALAELNALPENRYYLYDYYRNNCSTLPRDLIDHVVLSAVKGQTVGALTHSTFRLHTLRLLSDNLLAYAGAQLALGHPADYPITNWQEMFLPLKLQEHIRKVTIPGKTGLAEPLVKREFQLAAATRPPEPAKAPNYLIRFTITGVAIAALIIVLLSLSLTGLRTTKVLLSVVVTIWSLLAGLAGTGLILAWTVSSHVFMANNENLFQFNPLMLFLGLCFPLAFRISRLRQPAVILATSAAAISVVGFLLQLLPSMDQPNGEIIALAMPVHLATTAVCWLLFADRMKTARPQN